MQPNDAASRGRVVEGPRGRSLVAARALPAGSEVAQFDGPVVAFRAVPAEEVRYVLWIGPDQWLIPATSARFVNHSCAPNCLVDGDLRVLTSRPVAQAEELAFDYALAEDPDDAESFWDPRWTFTCQCGSPGCRGVIDRYVRPQEQRR